jgi:hypothetical protein
MKTAIAMKISDILGVGSSYSEIVAAAPARATGWQGTTDGSTS